MQGFLYRFLEDLPLRALEGFLGLKIYVDVARLTPQSDHESRNNSNSSDMRPAACCRKRSCRLEAEDLGLGV